MLIRKWIVGLFCRVVFLKCRCDWGRENRSRAPHRWQLCLRSHLVAFVWRIADDERSRLGRGALFWLSVSTVLRRIICITRVEYSSVRNNAVLTSLKVWTIRLCSERARWTALSRTSIRTRATSISIGNSRAFESCILDSSMNASNEMRSGSTLIRFCIGRRTLRATCPGILPSTKSSTSASELFLPVIRINQTRNHTVFGKKSVKVFVQLTFHRPKLAISVGEMWWQLAAGKPPVPRVRHS